MSTEESNKEKLPTVDMENNPQEEASNEALNASMDMTVVQEDSMDESHTTEDLQVTLQEAMALRKNLESKFEEEVATDEQPTSIREKIDHFEKKSTQNRLQAGDNAKKPPATIVTAAAKETAPSRLKVFLRVRPCASKETSTIEILDNSDGKSLPTAIRTYPPEASNAAKTDRARLKKHDATCDTHSIKEYEFTSVLDPSTSQVSVFGQTAAPLVNNLCRGNSVGKSALLFCYGITNAGKTHTVLGDPRKQESWGIIPRCLATLLQKVENTDMEVYLSSFEIYNEQLLDLLPSPSENQNRFASSGAFLKIREGPHSQMIIPGLAEYKVESMKMALSLIRRAKEGRHTAPNHLNSQSSRSHSICQITVRKRVQPSENGDPNELQQVKDAHLWIVDLAGNERSKRTNAGSLRQKEATYINMSLMNLMRCLTRTVKPYRDSKLTMLFMHHWSNPENTTTMIVNVNGAASDYDETQHVLSYAISSKSIPIVATKQQTQAKGPEYDLDGRRKGGKQLTMVQKAAKMMRKLSPKRVMPARKRKNPAPAVHDPFGSSMEGLENPKEKKTRRDEETMIGKGACPMETYTQHPVPSSRELASLQMQLAVAKAENQSLQSKNRELTQQLESAETSIRSEVAEEMLQEMMDMRRRYETTINKLKQSFIGCEHTQDSAHLEQAQSKIDELVEKVEECEEKMSRMSRIHRAELKELKEDHQAALSTKEEEIKQLKEKLSEKSTQAREEQHAQDSIEVAKLKKQLAASRAEVEQIKSSKEEMAKSYEQLLAPDEEEEENDGDESEEEEKDDEEEMDVEEEEEKEKDEEKKEEETDDEEEFPTPVQESKDESIFLNASQASAGDETNAPALPDLTPNAMERDKEASPATTTKSQRVEIQSISTYSLEINGDSASTTSQPAPKKTGHKENHATASSKKQTFDRKPLSDVNKNVPEIDELSDADSFGPEKWLAPKRPAVKDPKTGLFARPKGRAPSAADRWDSKKGAWRLSMAN
eukprot:scaffold27769_cov176-Amphora_coffeaeformis.AAC.7